MKCSVHIQTPFGLQELNSLNSKLEYSKKNNLLTWFRQYCLSEAMKKELEIIQYLEKTEMTIDDSLEDMQRWKEMSDSYSLHKYFGDQR
jgi:hypothetical protein